ncbi:regulator of protease activity HflC (stomatin/prohibitin superfamily) [Scopulibacillus daqui]|uniref:Regulator of protease activity HflC (Stomatin/prohibitin superfamily) n=1 Tax=Scopulibacillus daqui TaxID=1469162 RepID=A0ABS2Q2H4_9BACL|nr:SPFH domain-containing protein [Scopulibacillus daqui]MBM7645742.1 regulator of protease activity HflC (stomatin/prohibitin superfamily) [Scopulibacillus daqui]
MKDRKAWHVDGFIGVLCAVVCVVIAIVSLFQGVPAAAAIALVIAALIASGITIIQPNQAAVVIFFGKYMGTIRKSGLIFTVPLTKKRTVSLRVRNFNSERLKVNDDEGNPIEIAAVIVFKVIDPAKAIFDVDEYEEFVEIQSETALRHVASHYPYDTFDDNRLTLRGNAEEVSKELELELQNRLKVSGVKVVEARLTHLAYSPEIAQAMLQRQQAAAIISARQKIVEGAVSMAKMAINELEEDQTIELDEERKVNMVNNLMVAIVSEKSAQPVINAGSLY